MRKKLTKVLSLLLVLSFVLTACGNKEEVVDDKENHIITALSTEPASLDPGLAKSVPESWVLSHLFTGLLSYDQDGNLVEGMSEMPEISKDGLVYTFRIKDNMKWSNGDSVTAEDFRYEWFRILNPKTASSYAYQMYYIKGAKAYNEIQKPGVYYVLDENNKKTKEIDYEIKYDNKDLEGIDISNKTEEEVADLVYEKWLDEGKSHVGINVIDDKTLEVTLESPIPYFGDLTAFYTYYPVNSKVAKENPDWAKESGESYISNGPFTLKNWEHNNKIEIVKNDNWYDAQNVKIDKITFELLEEINTIWQNYESGNYSIIIDAPQEIIAKNIDESNKELKFGKIAATNYCNFNIRQNENEKNPFANKNIRQAFSMALDRQTLVDVVTKGGEIPATGFVPFGFHDENGKDFREESGNLIEYNPEEAKSRLDLGLKEEGLTREDINSKVLLYTNDKSNKKIAEAIQQMWQKALDVQIEIEDTDFNVKVTREEIKDFEMSLSGWTGDYNDPMTMLDLFVTNRAMNDSGFTNEKYDELIENTKNSYSQKIRMDSMRESEKILIDEMPIIPMYFKTLPYFVKENVKGVYKPLIEYPIMTYAEISE